MKNNWVKVDEEDIKQYLQELAEQVVKIPKGGKVGRWDRETRIALVFSVLYSIYKNSKYEGTS